MNALLFYGADPSVTDGEGRTALHHAVNGSATEILCLLLQWSTVCINTKDEHGLTPLCYSVLQIIRRSASGEKDFGILLDFGADAAETLELAIRHNQLACVSQMMRCVASKRSVVVKKKKDKSGLKKGNLVWARFSDRGSWQLARVARVDAQTLQVVEGRGDLPNEDQCCFLAIGGLPFSRARLVDERRDVPTAAKTVLLEHFKDASIPKSTRNELLEQHTGHREQVD